LKIKNKNSMYKLNKGITWAELTSAIFINRGTNFGRVHRVGFDTTGPKLVGLIGLAPMTP